MQDINEDLKKELLNEKERAYGFEQSLKDLLDQGKSTFFDMLSNTQMLINFLRP